MAASSKALREIYREFQILAEKWPIDPSRKTRDLGEQVRQCLMVRMHEGGMPEREAQMNLKALQSLSHDEFKAEFSRENDTNFTGQTPQESQMVLSDEGQQYLKQRGRSLLQKLGLKK